MSVQDFDAWLATRCAHVEQALADSLPADAPAGLCDVMRYAVLGEGKRLRPLLVLATAEALGGLPDAALRAACAVEIIHAYSLVHDDLPCMDDDVLRRGQATAHVKFGEARALLAGDALQALAFELLTPAEAGGVPAAMQAGLCRLLAQAAGAAGMAGGQAIDLASVGRRLDVTQLRHMHQLKTGALLLGSVRLGRACALQPVSAPVWQALDNYGTAIGLAYQVVDDILDATVASEQLGKTAGKDAAQDKPTYVSLLGLAEARALAQRLRDQALQALDEGGINRESGHLHALADRLIHRNN
ncbi:MAG: polyprenyl synthetase family protein [Ottowia sp.]|nr:polyprenyl synthetase family protein [Ottowia sp.]